MKPADFFLDRRQFLGFLLPGALWAGSGFWLCGRNPFTWLEQANGVRIVAFVLGSYVAGYVLQSAIFTVMDEAKRWRTDMLKRLERGEQRQAPWRWLREQKENSRQEIAQLRGMVRAAMKGEVSEAELNDHQLGQFCKRYGAKHCEYFHGQFLQIEDEINFTRAAGLPILVFASLTAIRFFIPALPSLPHAICVSGALGTLLICGAYLLWRFGYARIAEEEAWYRTFLMVWPSDSGPQKKK